MRLIGKRQLFWLLLSQLLILYVCLINITPKGFIISGADSYQRFAFPGALKQIMSTWTNTQIGEGTFNQIYPQLVYLVPVAFFSQLFNLPASTQSFFYYAFFLFGSFWSFYLFLKLYPVKVTTFAKACLSLIYTFSMVVYWNFYFTWFIQAYLTIYLFIPLVSGLIHRLLTEKTSRWKLFAASLIPVFFLNMASFGNFPFLIAYLLYIPLYIIITYFISQGRKLSVFIGRSLIIFLSLFMAAAWAILPQLTEMFRLVNVVGQNIIFDLKGWIIWQSVPLSNTFFYVFDLQAIFRSLSIFGYLSGLPLIIVICYLVFNRSLERRKDILKFIIIFLIFIFLANKGKGYLPEETTWWMFKSPPQSALRSSDKTLVFLPFIFLASFALVIERSKLARKLLPLILVTTILSVHPMFNGSLQKRLSASIEDGRDYLTSKYAYFIKIPQEYFTLSQKTNREKLNQKNFGLPYSVINSVGWVNYIAWHEVGSDPTHQLFTHPTVQMNDFTAFPNWNYGQEWVGQETYQSLWLVRFMSFQNIKYVLNHKDIDPYFATLHVEDKLKEMVKVGALIKDYATPSFDIYHLDKKLQLPPIYFPQNSFIINYDLGTYIKSLTYTEQATRSATFFNNQITSVDSYANPDAFIEYKKINATKYRVLIKNLSSETPIILSESFNPGWRIYLLNYSQNKYPLPDNLDAVLKEKYQIFPGNEEDQVNVVELADYIKKNKITYLGDLKTKTRENYLYSADRPTVTSAEEYKIDFVSKETQQVIQNDNLPDGGTFESWFKTPVDAKHLTANGYSNGWIIDPRILCQKAGACRKNEAGGYDLELLIEFSSQKQQVIGLFLSLGGLILSVIYLIKYRFFRK